MYSGDRAVEMIVNFEEGGGGVTYTSMSKTVKRKLGW